MPSLRFQLLGKDPFHDGAFAHGMERLSVGLEVYRTCSWAFGSKLFEVLDPPGGLLERDGEIPSQKFTRFHLESLQSTAVEDGSDWIVLIIQFIIVHICSWWGRRYIWEPLAKSCMRRPTPRNVQKFSAIATANLFHSLSAIFAWRMLYDRDWLWERAKWSIVVDEVEPDVKFFYLLYAARYISDAISLLFEITKEDSWAFAVHHIASVGLVLGSAASGYVRIGCVFMFFLDWVDIVLTAAKLLKYSSKKRNDIFQILADRLFELFAVSFIITRNGVLNYVAYVCLVDFENAPILKTQVVVLVMLMTYWLVLILKHAIHQLFGDGSIDDLRESDDEEEDEEVENVDKKRR
uniref:TLC domain-containing protein n=1 Tax=Attheya septentrionalis TaxID=420275 RepID=A0A7S2UR35_9STRA|mmetsp:Transcript_8851/g.16100  ORF Transcript_8851/g.16100 Transcript_8851/m.16100 type:complete len:350 (+) Transcript_8851:108-1157(+)